MFDALTAKQTMGDGDTLLCLISALISSGSLIKKKPSVCYSDVDRTALAGVVRFF